jgi:hypothetical protein
MRKEYFKRVLKTGGKAALLIALVAVPAYAITTSTWVHPCADANDLVCYGQFGTPPCACNGDFDNDDHWRMAAPDGNIANMTHSNDLISGEDFLRMAFTNETVNQLRVITKDTGGDDELDVLFDDAATLTVSGELKIDATNGKATLRVDSGGEIVTQ